MGDMNYADMSDEELMAMSDIITADDYMFVEELCRRAGLSDEWDNATADKIKYMYEKARGELRKKLNPKFAAIKPIGEPLCEVDDDEYFDALGMATGEDPETEDMFRGFFKLFKSFGLSPSNLGKFVKSDDVAVANPKNVKKAADILSLAKRMYGSQPVQFSVNYKRSRLHYTVVSMKSKHVVLDKEACACLSEISKIAHSINIEPHTDHTFVMNVWVGRDID